jgi:hypothetical protein
MFPRNIYIFEMTRFFLSFTFLAMDTGSGDLPPRASPLLPRIHGEALAQAH